MKDYVSVEFYIGTDRVRDVPSDQYATGKHVPFVDCQGTYAVPDGTDALVHGALAIHYPGDSRDSQSEDPEAPAAEHGRDSGPRRGWCGSHEPQAPAVCTCAVCAVRRLTGGPFHG